MFAGIAAGSLMLLLLHALFDLRALLYAPARPARDFKPVPDRKRSSFTEKQS
jgi:hypothetical protein